FGDLFAHVAPGAGHDRHLILEFHKVLPFYALMPMRRAAAGHDNPVIFRIQSHALYLCLPSRSLSATKRRGGALWIRTHRVPGVDMKTAAIAFGFALLLGGVAEAAT